MPDYLRSCKRSQTLTFHNLAVSSINRHPLLIQLDNKLFNLFPICYHLLQKIVTCQVLLRGIPVSELHEGHCSSSQLCHTTLLLTYHS